jgi:hypothetical protein
MAQGKPKSGDPILRQIYAKNAASDKLQQRINVKLKALKVAHRKVEVIKGAITKLNNQKIKLGEDVDDLVKRYRAKVHGK